MINDRLTAKVLGALAIFLAFVIDVSCFLFVKPEVRNAMFPVVVLVPSLPIFALGAFLLRRAAKLPESQSDDEKQRR